MEWLPFVGGRCMSQKHTESFSTVFGRNDDLSCKSTSFSTGRRCTKVGGTWDSRPMEPMSGFDTGPLGVLSFLYTGLSSRRLWTRGPVSPREVDTVSSFVAVDDQNRSYHCLK